MSANKDPETLGGTFGRLLVISVAEDVRKGHRAYNCECACGRLTVVGGDSLRSGNTRSCGCLISDGVIARNTTHGHSGMPEYAAWSMTHQRCYNPGQRDYRRYGARGIKVCQRWHNFADFLADMGSRPAGHTLERLDNDGDYEPGNCVWATRRAQSLNKSVNVHITCWGQTKTLSEWAESTGIPYSTLKARIRRLGYAPEVALTKEIKAGQQP